MRNNVDLALKAFHLRDDITGAMTGGIEPPRKILSVEENDCIVTVKWTYPKFAGLSDVTYHCTDAGKEFTDVYDFSVPNKVTCNGSEDIFGVDDCSYYKSYIAEFYNSLQEKPVIEVYN